MSEMPQESLTTILYRLNAIETSLLDFKQQLQAYDTARENDLKMQRISDTATRIEGELRAVKVSVEEMNTRMLVKESESKQRDAEATASQDKLQIKVLVSILSAIILVVSSLLIFYITHQ